MTTKILSQKIAPLRKAAIVGATAVLAALALGAGPAHAQSTFTPIRPPSIPLIVRTPYVSSWLQTDEAPGGVSNFWRDNTMGLTMIASVDGSDYVLIGAPGGIPNALQTGLKTTPTQSIFSFTAGKAIITADFLSPVEANDLRRLSMPLGDIVVQAKSADGSPHTVSVYCDITGEWAYGDSTGVIEWAPQTFNRNLDGSKTAGKMDAWEITLQNPSVLTELDQYPSWGTQVLATAAQTGLTYQSGFATTVRAQFMTTGVLADTNDTNQPRAINNNLPVFAYAMSLGSVGATPTAPFKLLLGHIVTPAINYHNLPAPPLWQTYWATYQAMLAFAYNDSASALTRANSLDLGITQAATQIGGTQYAGLCALSLRQAFGGTDLVGTPLTALGGTPGEAPVPTPGALSGSPAVDPMMFMKEISSSGSGGDVSTVDVIYPAFPAFLYTDPTLVRLLLEPVISYSEAINPATGLHYFDQPYAIHDLGGNYPDAIGHDDGGGETMPVEESANMLIMAAAYMRYNATQADSAAYSKAHYAIFKQWADYLLSVPSGGTLPNALDPPLQLATDDFEGPIANSTGLALKGIIGVGAMGQIAAKAGNTTDAAYYSRQAKTLIAEWATMAQNSNGTHLLRQYGGANTDWGLKYNAYPDKLLGLNLIPTAVLAEEAAFYHTVEQTYGIALDASVYNFSWGNGQYSPPPGPLAKLDWELWTAAAVNDPSLRQDLIDEVYNFADATTDPVPFDDDYNTLTAHKGNFVARTVVGGEYAPLIPAPTNLVAWYKADAITGIGNKGAVPSWVDSSGSGNTATVFDGTPTYASAGINGLPAVQFSASSSTALAFPRPVQDDFTILCVFRSSQKNQGAGTAYFNGAGLVNGEVPTVVNDFGTSLSATGQVCAGTGNPDKTIQSPGGFNDNKPHLLTFKRVEATGALTLYVDGNQVATGTGGTESLTAPGKLAIGAQQSLAAGGFFTGDIGEVQVYNQALPDTGRQFVECYLMNKWGITATAPPAAPTNLTATVGTTGGLAANAANGVVAGPVPLPVVLTWTPVPNAASYSLHRGTTPGGEGAEPFVTGITASVYSDTQISGSTTYYYKIVAVGADGTSPLSGEVSALTPAAGLAAWFKADAITGLAVDAPIPAWFDVSGDGNEATTPTAAPVFVPGAVNSLSAAQFTEASDTALVFHRPVQDDFTILCVYRSTQSDQGAGIAYYQGAGLVNGEVPGVVNDFGTSLNANGQICVGTGDPDTFVASGNGYNDGKTHLLTFKRVEATGATTLYVDGNQVATGAGGTESLTAPNVLALGAQQPLNSGGFLNGDIGEVQVYSQALSDTDRQIQEQALIAKWGVGR